jgi:ATP-dependent protease HslVU (ClpYQ) peptidase subunit
VEAITEEGVVANGKEHELDCLIYVMILELATEWVHRSGMEMLKRWREDDKLEGLETTRLAASAA